MIRYHVTVETNERIRPHVVKTTIEKFGVPTHEEVQSIIRHAESMDRTWRIVDAQTGEILKDSEEG